MSSPPQKINLVRIAHIYYTYPNLSSACDFLLDFGFTEVKTIHSNNNKDTSDTTELEKIYFRGYGKDPWVLCAIKGETAGFGGAGFLVESEADLRLAAATLPRASEIYELGDAPGGGKCVTFHDPVDGWPMHLVHGSEEVEMLDITLPQVQFNYVSRVHLSAPFFSLSFLFFFFFGKGPVTNGCCYLLL